MSTKSILITGCSSGIGLHAALTLSARGYQVFATARKAQDVTELQ
ncbi:MAG: NAD(P)-dependent dehydrogenase (short-subunit alcohol dehydrogenase family), partial [Cognaticolwellia sp.]